MTTGIQGLYDQRARLIEQMVALPKAAAAEGRAMSTEESEKFAKIEKDEAQLTKTIEAHESAERMEARMAGKHFESVEQGFDQHRVDPPIQALFPSPILIGLACPTHRLC